MFHWRFTPSSQKMGTNVNRADLVITSLSSDEAVEAVYNDLFAGQEGQGGKGDGIVPGGKGRSTIFIDTSTVSPQPEQLVPRVHNPHSH